MKRNIIKNIKLNLQLLESTNNPELKKMVAYSIRDMLFIIDSDIDEVSYDITANIEYRKYLIKAMEVDFNIQMEDK